MAVMVDTEAGDDNDEGEGNREALDEDAGLVACCCCYCLLRNPEWQANSI